jgi:molybdopterin-containing oxidoreductase family iron-sulfur binding subunit
MTRPIFVIDLDACLGCNACVTVCKQESSLGLGSVCNKILQIGPSGRFPDLEMYYVPVSCQQCENPICVSVCPTGASYKREDGVVVVNNDRCIGCQYCVVACPYGCRYYNHDADVVEKCTMCVGRLKPGEKPACARACPAQCRIYGDLDDPDSEVSVALREAGENVYRLMDVGNTPSVAYVLHNHSWRSG